MPELAHSPLTVPRKTRRQGKDCRGTATVCERSSYFRPRPPPRPLERTTPAHSVPGAYLTGPTAGVGKTRDTFSQPVDHACASSTLKSAAGRSIRAAPRLHLHAKGCIFVFVLMVVTPS